jgi:hypothetical protein
MAKDKKVQGKQTVKTSPKLNELKQTHGKTQNTQITSLAQFFGETDNMKYGTNDASEYERQLNEMNMSDLYAHAANLGIRPSDNRDRLTRTLINEFLGHIAAFNRPMVTNNGKKVSKEIVNILREGE